MLCFSFIYLHSVLWSLDTIFFFFFFLFRVAVATTIGTAVAYVLVPMQSLGQDSWKIAAALMGRHIGGGNLLLNFLSYRNFKNHC